MTGKNSLASEMVIEYVVDSLSAVQVSSVSALKRRPRTSQGTSTSERNCISMVFTPAPLQASQRPPATLKQAARCSRVRGTRNLCEEGPDEVPAGVRRWI